MIVPKVTARPETAIVYAALENDWVRARALIKDMPVQEREVFMSQLACITGLLRERP